MPKIARSRPMRRLAVLLLMSAVALTAIGAAQATLRIKWYSFGDSACTSQVDPVTTIFYENGYPDTVQHHISFHTGWDPVWFASPQYFSTNTTCVLNTEESASASFVQTRYHVRLKRCEQTFQYQSCDDTDTLGIVTIATPHFEDITSCGHAVRETVNGWSGYDEARRKLYNTMYTGHYTYDKYLGNSKMLTQCDGGVANSNGQGRWIQIPSTRHES